MQVRELTERELVRLVQRLLAAAVAREERKWSHQSGRWAEGALRTAHRTPRTAHTAHTAHTGMGGLDPRGVTWHGSTYGATLYGT